MRVFIIHLSPKTCQNFSLKETHITPLLESLKLQGISYEIFDAIYSKISHTQLHPLVLEHLHPSFMVEDLLAFCENKKHPPLRVQKFLLRAQALWEEDGVWGAWVLCEPLFVVAKMHRAQ